MTEWNMDRWKFFDITHRHHLLCNPTSSEKLDEIIRLLDLQAGDTVVDIACGKAELLARLVERYGVAGVGVDLSPYVVRDAEAKKQERVPQANLQFVHMDGADYQPQKPVNLAMCIGASWTYGGHRGTLRALADMTRPGGLVLVGEPFWIKPPPDEYLAAEGLAYEEFSTHYGNILIGEEEGLTFLYTVVSNHDDWDRYEGLTWYAAAKHAIANPKDPDLPEIAERVRRSRENYLRWGREHLGWAIYLFHKPA